MLAAAIKDPGGFISQLPENVTLDEVQRAPELLLAIKRKKFGHLLESFILQQLIAQVGWTDPDLRFWHYRDKDQVEVDVVITRGTKVWGVEVKASATLHHSDGNGLRRLAAQAGNDFQSGIVFYDGSSVLQLDGPKILAVPLNLLWEW